MTNITVDIKTFRKVAFAIGFGYSMGKYTAGMIQAVYGGVIDGICKSMLKHASKTEDIEEQKFA